MSRDSRNFIGRFLDGLCGHRMYLLAATVVLAAVGKWVFGDADAGDVATACGAAVALVGATELTGAVRDRANTPAHEHPVESE